MKQSLVLLILGFEDLLDDLCATADYSWNHFLLTG